MQNQAYEVMDESILAVRDMLVRYAREYEGPEFLKGDPSWFMHQVDGRRNQEAMAFIASSISYGSRRQFMPKIQTMLDWSGGDVDGWIRDGRFGDYIRKGDTACFYRLYDCDTMHRFLSAYRQMMQEHGTLGDYVRQSASDGFGAVAAICRYFTLQGASEVIPKDTTSACKRVCMFLRWMVRKESPVDLGLWDFIDPRTLIMPLDTHVLQQSVRLGLLSARTASMSTARRLTAQLAQVFPSDPLRADFALFGFGVNNK